jgi:outer membrane biogenesis lipoprotein LolB
LIPLSTPVELPAIHDDVCWRIRKPPVAAITSYRSKGFFIIAAYEEKSAVSFFPIGNS